MMINEHGICQYDGRVPRHLGCSTIPWKKARVVWIMRQWREARAKMTRVRSTSGLRLYRAKAPRANSPKKGESIPPHDPHA